MVDERLWHTREHFVAYMDIMGFKDLIYRENKLFIYDKLSSLYKHAYIHQSNTKLVIFSDSIILISSSDESEKAAIDLLKQTQSILLFAIEAGIPIKGAIAYGELTIDDEYSVCFGIPLIDAYELHNEMQLYGVVLHHTAENRLSKLNVIKNLERYFILDYPVPMKSGEITHYLVNWTRHPEELQVSLSNFYHYISGKPRVYIDNTLKFIRWITEKKV